MLEIVPYDAEDVAAVRDMNRRLQDGGHPTLRFPEAHVSSRFPKINGRQTYEEYFVAREQQRVRGAYILKRQPCWVAGELRPVASIHLPLSEGLIDRAYGVVGVQLFGDAIRRSPLLYGLGNGSMDAPSLAVLRGLRAAVRAVPFYFRVVRGATFCREIAHLRTTRARALALDAAAAMRLGPAAIGLAQAIAGRPRAGASVEIVAGFDRWFDDLWERCKGDYAMVGLRDRATLAILYPDTRRFITMRVTRGGRAAGWVVALATRMSGNPFFGNMTVGTIVDCLAPAQDAEATIAAATTHLERAGVDIIVSNQSAAVWRHALRRSGYLRGPSNFVFAASKALAGLLGGLDEAFDRLHITRGDGEGPGQL